jgi:ABC-type transporter MlaC component
MGIAALAALVSSHPPAAAFSIHLGRFYFHLPLPGHHRHHPMRTNRNEARPRPNESGGDSTARGRNGAEQNDREARAETNTAALESCTGLMPAVTNLPIDQIRQIVHPTTDQKAALDNLSAAASQAREIIKSSCPASVPLTPIARLDAAAQRLDATIKAIQIVLPPLGKFYETLSDEQRERFNAMNGSTESARSSSDMAALCSQQTRFIDVPTKRVEQVVQPNAQQQSAFDDLKRAAQKAADQLRSSCPTAVPKSPTARLDTLAAHASAIAEAIKAIRPNLKNFYASLSDEQRARFNMMGQGRPPALPAQ